MVSSSFYEIATPEVVAEDFVAEIVVLNLASGKYFSLTGLAADLWRDLQAGHSLEALLGQLDDSLRVQSEAMQQLVSALVSEQLIRPRSSSVLASPDPMEASVWSGLRAGALFPALEGYDDMAELILSDPIHDVDEQAGWPVKPRS